MRNCGTQDRISPLAEVFITTASAIYKLGHSQHTLTAVPRSTTIVTLHRVVKLVSPLEQSNNNKWQWWLWTVATYRQQTQSLSWLVEGQQTYA